MKKITWVSKGLILVLMVILIYLAFRIQFIYSENKFKNEIIESVSENIAEFTDYSLKMTNEKISSGEFKGFRVKKDPDYQDIVNYSYKGIGIGIGGGTIYYGVYYIPDDRIDIFFNGRLQKKDNISWFYSEKNSDNTMYIEKIDEHSYKNTY